MPRPYLALPPPLVSPLSLFLFDSSVCSPAEWLAKCLIDATAAAAAAGHKNIQSTRCKVIKIVGELSEILIRYLWD